MLPPEPVDIVLLDGGQGVGSVAAGTRSTITIDFAHICPDTIDGGVRGVRVEDQRVGCVSDDGTCNIVQLDCQVLNVARAYRISRAVGGSLGGACLSTHSMRCTSL
jgi:hypothetical protein